MEIDTDTRPGFLIIKVSGVVMQFNIATTRNLIAGLVEALARAEAHPNRKGDDMGRQK